jgi:hypothetical protein
MRGEDVSMPEVDDPVIESTDDPVEPEMMEEPVSDPVVEETDPCADGYPPEPYECSESIEWNLARSEATWIGGGGTLDDYCLPNQDDEVVCIGDHFCSPDVDFIVIASNTFW